MHLGEGSERQGTLARFGAMLALVASMLVVHWGLPAPVAVKPGAGADSHAGAARPSSQREIGRAAQVEVHRLKSVPSGDDGAVAGLSPTEISIVAGALSSVAVAGVGALPPRVVGIAAFDARGPPRVA